MLKQFRASYPQGSLISELVTINHGKYLVRTLVQVQGNTLATGLAAADTVEQAEDRSRERALVAVDLSGSPMPLASYQQQAQPSQAFTLDSDSAHRESPHSNAPSHSPLNASDATSVNTAQTDISFSNQEPTRSRPANLTVPPPASDALGDSSPSIPKPSLEKREEQPTFEQSPEFAWTPEQDSSSTDPPNATKANTSLESEESLPAKAAASYSFGVNQEPSSELPETESWQSSTQPSTDKSLEAQTEAETALPAPLSAPIDFSDIIAKTNVEMKRLGWNSEQGRKYLLETYGKRSRQLLSDEELLDFLHHLESLSAS